MPNPVRPSDFEELIPAPDAPVCEGFFRRLLRLLPERIWAYVAYQIDAQGNLTDEYIQDIQEACGITDGGTTPTTDSLSAPVLTVGAISTTQVSLSWLAITNATLYDIYRNTTTDVGSATIVGSTAGTTLDDTSVTPGVVYYYWAKAKNEIRSSAYSSMVSAYAAQALTAISDLVATKGFGWLTTNTIDLVFSAVSGATVYDIYRGTTTDFEDAEIITGGSNRVPFDNTDTLATADVASQGMPVFIDNKTDLVFQDNTMSTAQRGTTFYYWVVAKKMNGTQTVSISSESNMATGWSQGIGDLPKLISNEMLSTVGSPVTVPSGAVRAFVVFFGAGAGGAGGNNNYGAGGGGSGATVWGVMNVTAGKHFKLTGPTSTAGGAAEANGSDSTASSLQYDGTGSYVDAMTSGVASGGQWNASGGGAGGAGATGGASGAVTDAVVKDGRAGEAAVGPRGGRGGHMFGVYRVPAQHWNSGPWNTLDGLPGQGGGGSSSVIPTSLATGASSGYPHAIIHWLNA